MRYTLGIITIVLLFSCDNTLVLNAEYQDIPIVYGLLSVSEENQFIRVERAFLDPDRSATEIAVISDSIYYPSLDVQLVNLRNNEVHTLRKVNGNEIGLPRDEGAFAVDPNTLYTIGTSEMSLSAGESYELVINRGEGKEAIRATTTVVDTILITQPSTRLNFDINTNFRVSWFPKSTGNVPSVYDVSMIVNFEEVNTLDPDMEPVPVTLEWSLAKSITDETEILKLGNEFFVFLQNNIEVKENIRRDFIGIDVVIDAGGQEILDYVRVGQANLGITASQEIPFYTNLSEGRGIFSSRNRKFKKRVLLTPVAQNVVKSNDLTKSLNFNF
ncbi:hypothetical protein [Portibacter lacus]|uniref:DUF4249 family protein n=1 Tax=Portibacter lacus TaxID=1099794 RepID=A0AA37STW0_9BACT|nr:hypothetical protein [Portibacter lacus]GLR20152.1 hypothetical protein GCM10007940_47680 [Portibacter lacus]